MNITRSPIAMFQWSPECELNELESIEDRHDELAPAALQPEVFQATASEEAFREYAARQIAQYPGDALQDWCRGEEAAAKLVDPADVASFRVIDSDPQAVVGLMKSLFRVMTNAQTVYFSCHGTVDTLAFDVDMTSTLSFADFGTALASLKQDCVTLVLGCCYGLNEQSTILKHIPSQVAEIFAFTGKPLGSDVASLMLGVLLDQSSIFAQASAANHAHFGEGDPFSESDTAAAQLGAAIDKLLDAFEAHPAAHVRGTGGVGIRWLQRVEYGGTSVWQGRTIPLRDRM